MMVESPALRRRSPAMAGSDMNSPVRFLGGLDDLDQELQHGERKPSRNGCGNSSNLYESRKMLFDTPDSQADRQRRTGARGRSMADDEDDELLPEHDGSLVHNSENSKDGNRRPECDSGRFEFCSNTNPFCSLNESSMASSAPSAWTARSSRGSRSPDASLLFASPSVWAERSHTYSRVDSDGSLGLLNQDSPQRSQAKSKPGPGTRTTRKHPRSSFQSQPGESPGDGCYSPGGLCKRLKRTCSLGSDSEPENQLAESSMGTPGQGALQFPRFESDELLLDDDDDGDEGREKGGNHALARIQQRRDRSALQPPSPSPVVQRPAATRTPQLVLPSPPQKSRVRSCTNGGARSRGIGLRLEQQVRARVSRFKEEFEEQGVLGAGSFGTVYKCKNRLDGCLYAVKVTKQQFKGKADRERVLKEVYALSALCNAEDNPHIVRYFSAFVEEGRLYIQTELCDKSLQDMIRARQYPGGLELVARDMARQVLEGLARLHRHNLVHLDIKPANVFVKNGTFKIGDLGHACLARMQGQLGDRVEAVSPERQFPKKLVSASSCRGAAGGAGLLDVSAVSPVRHAVPPCFASDKEELPTPPPMGFPQGLSPMGSPGSGRILERDNVFDTSLGGLTPVKPERSPAPRVRASFGVGDLEEELAFLEGQSRLRQTTSAAAVGDVEEGDSRYMAPEILGEEYEWLPKGDIFSLGASMYEMCLGRELPANGPEWHEIRDGKLDSEALARYSPALRELVRLMLTRDPERRPSAETLLATGGPGGVLRTEWETKLAREKAAADEYRRRLARMNPTGPSRLRDDFELDDRFQIRRSNTM